MESITTQLFVQRTKRNQREGRGAARLFKYSTDHDTPVPPQPPGSLSRCFAIVASPRHLAGCGDSRRSPRRQLSSALVRGRGGGFRAEMESMDVPTHQRHFHIRHPQRRTGTARIGRLGPVTLRASPRRPMRAGTEDVEGLGRDALPKRAKGDEKHRPDHWSLRPSPRDSDPTDLRSGFAPSCSGCLGSRKGNHY